MSVVTNVFWCVVGFLETYNGAVTAVATVFIGVFTWVLAIVTNRQARLTRQSIDLAREEFVSTHRPRMSVYGVGFVGAASGHDDAEGPVRVCFHYVNSGDSPARVKMIGTKLVHLTKSAMPSEINFEVQKIEPPLEVKSGRHGFRLTVEEFDQEKFIFNSAVDTYRLVCVGFIVYLDDNGTDRQMGFCRRYDSDSDRWIAMDDPEYEYSY